MAVTTRQHVQYFAVLLVVWAWGTFGPAGRAAEATWFLCENVCSSSTACEETCYENMMEHENGNDITCLEWGVYDESEPCCGDFVCEAPEEVPGEAGYCGADCGPGPGGGSCGECSPSAQTGCGSNQVCNLAGCCIAIGNYWPPAPLCYDDYCETNADCCSGNVCLTHPVYQQYGVCVDNRIPG